MTMPDACPVNAQAGMTLEELLADVSFEEGEIRVAKAFVALLGTDAPRRCREISATCEAEEDEDAEVAGAVRASYLRFAGYAEKALAEAGMLA
jgi:hypothetical protein